MTELTYRAIRHRILDGVHDRNQFLREESLARALEISRTPVREALRLLVSEGWIEQIPYFGAYLVEGSRADADEVFELRSILAPHAARRATLRMEPVASDRLAELVDAMEVLAGSESNEARADIAPLNNEFHCIILTAVASPRQAGGCIAIHAGRRIAARRAEAAASSGPPHACAFHAPVDYERPERCWSAPTS
jgi:DNA-binding GntR family transcriptional regulator